MSGATTLAQTAPRTGLEVSPTGAALGAEVKGVDLRSLEEAEFAAVLAAWYAHGVLLFRGQTLTPDDLTAFSRRFGVLDHAPVQEHGQSIVAGRPELYIVSNVLDDSGKPIGSLGNGGSGVAHRHVLPAAAAQGLDALCAGDTARRRRHAFRLDVRG